MTSHVGEVLGRADVPGKGGHGPSARDPRREEVAYDRVASLRCAATTSG